MDELPSDAKEFLAAVMGVHDAPADPLLKDRLRAALGARLGLAAGVPAPAPGKLSWLGAKGKALIVAGVVAGSGLGGLWLVARPSAPDRQHGTVEVATPAQTQSAAPLPSAAEPAVSQPPALLAPTAAQEARPTSRAHVRRTPRSSSLLAETALLGRASQALAQHDATSALSALREHRTRFQQPLLLEERDGLSALAECMVDPRQGRARAAQFMARFPGSVLAVRVRHACQLSGASDTEQGERE